MRTLHIPIEQLAPDALVDGVLTPEWSGALGKAAGAILKAERELVEAYVKAILKVSAGRIG